MVKIIKPLLELNSTLTLLTSSLMARLNSLILNVFSLLVATKSGRRLKVNP